MVLAGRTLPPRLFRRLSGAKRRHSLWESVGGMQRACGLMGIRLLYAKPRNPQGKGKQERFNPSMEAFLDEIALKPPESLEDLNTLFSAWLNECYLTVEHSALGTTLEIAFRSDSMPPRFIDSAVLARA